MIYVYYTKTAWDTGRPQVALPLINSFLQVSFYNTHVSFTHLFMWYICTKTALDTGRLPVACRHLGYAASPPWSRKYSKSPIYVNIYMCSVLQCDTVCGNVLHVGTRVIELLHHDRTNIAKFLHIFICSVLQCVAVCCSVIKCVLHVGTSVIQLLHHGRANGPRHLCMHIKKSVYIYIYI